MEEIGASALDLDLAKMRASRVLGRGAMGTVFLVSEFSPSGCPVALKVVDKSTLQDKFDGERRARWEMRVLSLLSHPFLPTLLGAAESGELLAWALPYCAGGDLNVLRQRQTDRIFSLAAIRFYVAEIICAIECLHRQGLVYRDLKPENVLIQGSGHVMLTDFDLSRTLSRRTAPAGSTDPQAEPRRAKQRRNLAARMVATLSEKVLRKKAKSARVSPVSRRSCGSTGDRSNSFVGTDEYVSPEVIRGDGHEFSVDWWALGVLTYEMAYGRTPFRGKNGKETLANILMWTPEFIGKPSALTDLISRLLEKDPTRRLGFEGGASEIKRHGFFDGMRWDLLPDVSRPPYVPDPNDDGEPPLNSKTLIPQHYKGFNVSDYFHKLRHKHASSSSSSSLSPSSFRSSSSGRRTDASWVEF